MNVSQICKLFSTNIEWFNPVLQCFQEVYEELGHGLNESLYQKAIGKALDEKKIKHDAERTIPQFYKKEYIGTGRLDFCINNQGIIETKALKTEPRDEDIRQLHNYLLQTSHKLGICVNFPKHYQSNLTVLVIFHSSLLTSADTISTVEDASWSSFVIRIKSIPREHHKIKSLGICTISI
jgi:GxxExxY protein